MAKCIKFWKTRTSIWNDIMRTTKKTLIVEQEGDAFLEAYESFNKALDRSKRSSWSKVGLTNTDGSAKDDETAVVSREGGAIFLPFAEEKSRRHRFCRQSRTRGYFDWHPLRRKPRRAFDTSANFSTPP